MLRGTFSFLRWLAPENIKIHDPIVGTWIRVTTLVRSYFTIWTSAGDLMSPGSITAAAGAAYLISAVMLRSHVHISIHRWLSPAPALFLVSLYTTLSFTASFYYDKQFMGLCQEVPKRCQALHIHMLGFSYFNCLVAFPVPTAKRGIISNGSADVSLMESCCMLIPRSALGSRRYM